MVDPQTSSESVMRLSQRLLAPGTSVNAALLRKELHDRLQAALAELSTSDREILVMRNLEQMSAAEIAAVLGLKEGTVRVRHLRALERLRSLLDLEGEEFCGNRPLPHHLMRPPPPATRPSPSSSKATWRSSRLGKR